jgi:hypothetical protein
MEPTQCSETSALNTQTPGKYPEDNSSTLPLLKACNFMFSSAMWNKKKNPHNRAMLQLTSCQSFCLLQPIMYLKYFKKHVILYTPCIALKHVFTKHASLANM